MYDRVKFKCLYLLMILIKTWKQTKSAIIRLEMDHFSLGYTVFSESVLLFCIMIINLCWLQISHKPKSMSHIEAASIPYVGCTAWRALVDTGGLNEFNSANKRWGNTDRQCNTITLTHKDTHNFCLIPVHPSRGSSVFDVANYFTPSKLSPPLACPAL